MKINYKQKALTLSKFIASVYDAHGKYKARGIVRLAPWNNLCRLTRRIRTAYSTGRALKAHLVEFCGPQRFVISRRLQPRSKNINTLLETPPHEAETVERRQDDAGVARKTCRISRNQGHFDLRRLKATFRTIDSRYVDIKRTHWNKVWLSMVED
jgi:hypothetical protein